MKKTTGNNIRLGIFISIGIGLFIIGVYFIGKKQQLFSSTFMVSGIFKDISGLQIGNNVRFSGINVGIVTDIRLVTDTSVRVDMLINEDTRKFMKTNAKAIIGSDGLMGNKIMLIIPGPPNAKVLSDNDMIETTRAVSMDDILKEIKVTAENAADITSDLAIITDNIRQGKGTIGKLVMDEKLAHNVDMALVNIKKGAGGFKDNMDAASHNFLLKGFFKKKEKAKEAAKEEAKEKAGEKQKEKDNETEKK